MGWAYGVMYRSFQTKYLILSIFNVLPASLSPLRLINIFRWNTIASRVNDTCVVVGPCMLRPYDIPLPMKFYDEFMLLPLRLRIVPYRCASSRQIEREREWGVVGKYHFTQSIVCYDCFRYVPFDSPVCARNCGRVIAATFRTFYSISCCDAINDKMCNVLCYTV